jgi:hypothetical protein
MCYSAMIQADYEKYVRHYGATMSLEEFALNVWAAPDRAKKKRRPKAVDDWFRGLSDPKAQEIWREIQRQRTERETWLHQGLLKQAAGWNRSGGPGQRCGPSSTISLGPTTSTKSRGRHDLQQNAG